MTPKWYLQVKEKDAGFEVLARKQRSRYPVIMGWCESLPLKETPENMPALEGRVLCPSVTVLDGYTRNGLGRELLSRAVDEHERRGIHMVTPILTGGRWQDMTLEEFGFQEFAPGWAYRAVTR